MKNEIILFENQNVKLEVNVKDETVWLSLEQLATLFNRDRTVIKRHINNIFKEDELKENEVCAKFAHTTISSMNTIVITILYSRECGFKKELYIFRYKRFGP